MAPPGITSKIYRPRNPFASTFHRLVTKYFEELKRVYPERCQETYGFWRPVIKTSIEKFLQCGDLKHGFARVRCANCGEKMKVVALIEKDQEEVIEKILRHCDLWAEPTPRPPPQPEIRETVYVPDEDYQPFESLYA